MRKQEQEKLMFDAPIPGEGLTADPENRANFEKPPQYTDVKEFIDDLFLNITAEDNFDGILDSLRKRIPIEDITQLLLFNAFAAGKINTDLQLLAVEPTLYMLIGLGEMAGVEDMVLYPEESFAMSEEEQIQLLTQDGERIDPGEQAPDLEDLKVPKGISKPLLQKLTKGR